jgi:hypothetical protein
MWKRRRDTENEKWGQTLLESIYANIMLDAERAADETSLDDRARLLLGIVGRIVLSPESWERV